MKLPHCASIAISSLSNNSLKFIPVGGFGAWSIVINAFISDTSKPKDRSMRYGMLKLSETLGKPLGALLGNFILNEGGYVWAYATVLIGLFVASTYVCVIMSYHTWTTPKTTVNNFFN